MGKKTKKHHHLAEQMPATGMVHIGHTASVCVCVWWQQFVSVRLIRGEWSKGRQVSRNESTPVRKTGEEERPVLKGKGVRQQERRGDSDRDTEIFKSNKVETKHQMVSLCSPPFNLLQQLEVRTTMMCQVQV